MSPGTSQILGTRLELLRQASLVDLATAGLSAFPVRDTYSGTISSVRVFHMFVRQLNKTSLIFINSGTESRNLRVPSWHS